jgi:hypothetical protein
VRKNEASSTGGDQEDGKVIVHFSLAGLLDPNHRLVLHKETRTLSLLGEGPSLLRQQLLSDNELRVLIPILEVFPHYCPYEVLLASITSRTATQTAITRWRLRLQEARARGTWHQELRSIRRTLSSLRPKLLSFQLEISTVRERGCSLTTIAAPDSR